MVVGMSEPVEYRYPRGDNRYIALGEESSGLRKTRSVSNMGDEKYQSSPGFSSSDDEYFPNSKC